MKAKILFVILFNIFSLLTWAQVTIGMGEAPAKTALLQLKDQAADANNITSNTGGFLLPRVSLVNLQTLQPFMETTDAGYENEKRQSVGLFVYNINRSESDSIYPGLYCWTGERWGMLTMSGGDSGNGNDTIPSVEPPITNPEAPEALNLSNCYIVNSGKTVDIPVIKAYAVWLQIINVDRPSLNGTVTVDLLWQDHEDLIQSVTLANGDQGVLSEIRLTTNNQGYNGNAVIAMRINGLIYWSWHIWVTDYDPNAVAGQNTYNEYTFMDRNIGTTVKTPGQLGSRGLLYQWGRKDPFPNSNSPTGTGEKNIFDISNNPVSISKTDQASLIPFNNNYLQISVRVPNAFIFTTTTDGDWYASATANMNDYLWDGLDKSRTPYDPCPPGWRVPRTDNAQDASPWLNLPAQTFTPGTGLDDPSAGYYPASGYRALDSGNLTNVGTEGYTWYGSVLHTERSAFRLYFTDFTIETNQRGLRAFGASVRCAKE